MATSGGGGSNIAGLIVGDECDRYYAIAWEELGRFRVPAAWAAAIAALVRGDEPDDRREDLDGDTVAHLLPAGQALLIAAVTGAERLRPAARHLEAWALVR